MTLPLRTAERRGTPTSIAAAVVEAAASGEKLERRRGEAKERRMGEFTAAVTLKLGLRITSTRHGSQAYRAILSIPRPF